MAAAVFLIMLISWGVSSTFGVFFKPVLTEFGWTRAMTSGAFSLSMIIFGLLGILMGGLTDRFGPRMVLTVCGFLIGVGYLLMSQITTVWQFYLFYGVIIGIGMSGTWVPLLSTTARWFAKRRSVMTGFVVAGVGIGGLITPPLAQYLISAYGWPTAFTFLGSAVLVVVVLAAQLLRRDPAQKGLLPYGYNESQEHVISSGNNSLYFKQAVRTRQFWLMLGMRFSFGFCFFTIIVHIAPHATELGFSAATAANVLALIGGVSILGSVSFGNIGDRIGNRQTLSIIFALMSAAFFWLVPSADLWQLLLFASVFGFAYGGPAAVASPLAAELFGLKSHGAIFGVTSLGFTLGGSISSFLAGYIFDITGSYQIAFLVSAVVAIVGLILTTILRPIKRP